MFPGIFKKSEGVEPILKNMRKKFEYFNKERRQINGQKIF